MRYTIFPNKNKFFTYTEILFKSERILTSIMRRHSCRFRVGTTRNMYIITQFLVGPSPMRGRKCGQVLLRVGLLRKRRNRAFLATFKSEGAKTPASASTIPSYVSSTIPQRFPTTLVEP